MALEKKFWWEKGPWGLKAALWNPLSPPTLSISWEPSGRADAAPPLGLLSPPYRKPHEFRFSEFGIGETSRIHKRLKLRDLGEDLIQAYFTDDLSKVLQQVLGDDLLPLRPRSWSLLCVKLCLRKNMFKSQDPVPTNVSLFGGKKVFADEIK